MSEEPTTGPATEEYKGWLTLPGDTEQRQVSLFLDESGAGVSIQFDDEVAGATQWDASSVRMVRRHKYLEVQFRTHDLPQETIELAWKFNTGYQDDTLAGVVVARPNELRVSGEKGFTLIRPT